MSPVVNVMDKDIKVIELDSSCMCVFDEADFLQASKECFGCWQDALEDLEHAVLLPWLKLTDADNGDYIVASGSNVGWRRLSGEVSFELDYDDVVSDLLGWFSLNGDFRLTFKLDDAGELSVRRGSHDEPMGAYFTLKLVKRVEDAE